MNTYLNNTTTTGAQFNEEYINGKVAAPVPSIAYKYDPAVNININVFSTINPKSTISTFNPNLHQKVILPLKPNKIPFYKEKADMTIKHHLSFKSFKAFPQKNLGHFFKNKNI